jgi:TonB family protein
VGSKEGSDYDLSEIAKSTSLANWDLPEPGAHPHGKAQSGANETNSAASTNTNGARDFMSKGLMAYDQPNAPANAKNVRLPLMVGAVVLAVAAISGAAFFLRRGTAPALVTKAQVQSQPAAPVSPVPTNAAEPGLVPQLDAPVTQAQNAVQPIAGAQAVPAEPQTASVSTPLPDAVIGPATENARNDSRINQRQEKKAPEIRKPEPAPPARPAIQNLKMSSPIAPRQGGVNSGDASAPIADLAASTGTGAPTSAGLLSSAGRTSKPPVAPPGANVVFDTATLAPPAPAPATPAPIAAARTASGPKLISSSHVNYPTGAKESRIQGSVTLTLTVDAAGNVVAAKPFSGPPLLRQAAADSAKQWKYSPAVQDGKAVPSEVIVKIDFRLD